MNLEASWSSQGEYSIFLSQDGEYFVFGNNDAGSLGLQDLQSRCLPTPLQFPEGEGGGRGEMELFSGGQRHSLALMKDGRLFGWGQGDSGRLNQDRQDLHRPTLLNLPEPPVFLAAGTHASAAITRGGALYMGGKNRSSQVGGEGEERIFPSLVSGLPPVVEVAVGWSHTVARTEEGEVWGWGRNDSGEVGLGEQNPKLTVPTLLPPFPEKILKIVCGAYHTLFLGEKGTLWTCGWNHYGNTGHGRKKEPFRIPTKLKVGGRGERVREVAAGWCHSMVLLEDGTVWVWGCNSFGQLGGGSMCHAFVPSPLNFPPRKNMGEQKEEDGEGEGEEREGEGEGEEGEGEGEREGEVVGIGCCCDHSFLVTSKGDLWTWGRGIFGVLGHGDNEDLNIPKKVEGLKVRLPPPRSQWWWEEVGVWLFLGRVDGDSQFWGMPVEVVFHFVEFQFKR